MFLMIITVRRILCIWIPTNPHHVRCAYIITPPPFSSPAFEGHRNKRVPYVAERVIPEPSSDASRTDPAMTIEKYSNHSSWPSGSEPGTTTHLQSRGASVAFPNEYFAQQGTLLTAPPRRTKNPILPDIAPMVTPHITTDPSWLDHAPLAITDSYT